MLINYQTREGRLSFFRWTMSAIGFLAWSVACYSAGYVNNSIEARKAEQESALTMPDNSYHPRVYPVEVPALAEAMEGHRIYKSDQPVCGF